VIEWIRKIFGARTAVDKGRENPLLKRVVQASARLYERIPLRNFIDEDQRAELARALFLEINRICNATDPVTVCRDRLVATMLTLASFQVLLIPPEPEEDRSGLRGQPGISGQLGAHLEALCAQNDTLRSTMFGETGSDDAAVLRGIVTRQFWESYWLLGTLDATRVELGDTVEGDDWFTPFLHAACVNVEYAYRWELELPPAFDEDIAKEAANAYSVFTDIVLSGALNPAAEWRDYCRGSGVPMPDFVT